MILLRIVLGIKDDTFRERLLRESDLTLNKAANFVRAAERTKKHLNVISKELGDSEIDAISKNQQSNRSFQKYNSQNACSTGEYYDCKKYRTRHQKARCPAFGKTCSNC